MTLEKGCLLIDMEYDMVEDDGDPPMLIDSGTESFNASPNADEEHSHPTSPTVLWDIGGKKKPSVKNILDKSISVDEDSLIKPLEPVVCNNMQANNITNNNTTTVIECKVLPLMSILRRQSCYETVDLGERILTPRRVSFPDDLASLATYKEPEPPSPFNLCESLSSDEICVVYQNSCKKHHTLELDVIKTQISDIKNNINYSANLNLASINVTMEVCETLEDVFTVCNFRTVTIRDCVFTTESIREFVNILEYYNSAAEFVTSDHFKELEAWKMFCCMSSKSHCLEAVTLESFHFNDNYMKVLLNNMLLNQSICSIKFSSCNLGNRPTGCLVEALIPNTTLQELYLPQTGLYTKEADLLGKLLTKNNFLKVLDISNNLIGDRGLEVLAKGLCIQTLENCGLSVLVIFNNQITEKSGPIISKIISDCKNLHTLNLGFNNLTDEVISKMGRSLQVTKSLEGLGLQSTLLTDIGVALLAESIQKNSSLQKINLKGNKAIQNDGLLKLSQALTNTKIIKIEVDDTNRNCDNPQNFVELVQQIHGICTVNKSRAEQSTDTEVSNLSMYFSRKMSLSCEPIYYQPLVAEPRKKSPSASPIPSPGCSPSAKGRFSVQRVPDVLTPQPSSRFKVVPVLAGRGAGDMAANSPPPDDENNCTSGHFANVRSSVSSIESVDSISTNRDSVYDSATPSGESD